MKWWIDLLLNHHLSRSMGRWTLVALALMAVWPVPMALRLLGLLVLGSFLFGVSVVLYLAILLKYNRADIIPNYGTYGYFITSVTGFMFSMMFVVPSFLNLGKVTDAPVSWLSLLFVLIYFYHVVGFYLVSRYGYRLASGGVK